MPYTNWSTEEIALLRELYPIVRVKDLVNNFPKRTANTIVVKALSLKLPSAKLWQPEENLTLKKYFYSNTKNTLLTLLPKRTWLAILAQGERLNLKRNTSKPRRAVDENYFKKWSFNMAYVLGFILADGCVVKGSYKGYSNSLTFGVQLRDKDILEKIKSELKSNHKISEGKNAACLSIASNTIVHDLKKLEISYRKSLHEKIPNIPLKYIKDYIRGIVDGDGILWIDKRNYPTLSVVGGIETLVFIRNHFYSKFKIYSKLSTQKYSKPLNAYLYQISYRANSAKTLIDYLYTDAVLYLKRKHAIALQAMTVNIRRRKNLPFKLKQYESRTS